MITCCAQHKLPGWHGRELIYCKDQMSADVDELQDSSQKARLQKLVQACQSVMIASIAASLEGAATARGHVDISWKHFGLTSFRFQWSSTVLAQVKTRLRIAEDGLQVPASR